VTFPCEPGEGRPVAIYTGTISNIGFGDHVFTVRFYYTKYYYEGAEGTGDEGVGLEADRTRGKSCPNPADAFNQK